MVCGDSFLLFHFYHLLPTYSNFYPHLFVIPLQLSPLFPRSIRNPCLHAGRSSQDVRGAFQFGLVGPWEILIKTTDMAIYGDLPIKHGDFP